MIKFYGQYKKPICQTMVFALVLAIVYLFFKYALGAVAPFLTGLFISLIISKPVDFLSVKLRVPRPIATIFSMLVILGVLILIFNFAVRLLITQILSFSANMTYAFYKAENMYASILESYDSFFEFIPYDIRSISDQQLLSAVSSFTTWAGGIARSLSVSAVKVIPKTFIFLIITMISTFFLTNDKRKIFSFFARQLPANVSNTYLILKKDIFGALWGYIRAQLIMMSFSGLIAVVGLTILGYDYSLLFGLLIAFFDALPLFGPGFILWPWTAISLISQEFGFAIGLMAIYAAIIVCRQMLEPKVLSSQIGLYPLVTLFSMYVGLMTIGPAGLIAGPVLAIIIKSLQNEGLLPGWR